MSGSEGPNKPRGVALLRSYPRRRWRPDAWSPSRFAPATPIIASATKAQAMRS